MEILEIIRVILKLYDQWKNFDDRKEMAVVLNKMPKPKPPPNRSMTSPSISTFGSMFFHISVQALAISACYSKI